MKREYGDNITVISDNKWRNFLYRNEVPQKILHDRFSYLNEENGGFDGYFKYRDWWYHTSDFSRFNSFDKGEGDTISKDWQSYASDSYFSGTLLNISKDGEQYQVGRYMQ